MHLCCQDVPSRRRGCLQRSSTGSNRSKFSDYRVHCQSILSDPSGLLVFERQCLCCRKTCLPTLASMDSPLEDHDAQMSLVSSSSTSSPAPLVDPERVDRIAGSVSCTIRRRNARLRHDGWGSCSGKFLIESRSIYIAEPYLRLVKVSDVSK